MCSIRVHLIFLLATLNYISPKIEIDDGVGYCYLDRKGTNDIHSCPRLVNDPQFMNQWMHVTRPYHEFGGRVSVDLGIIDVWIQHRFFGNGVTVVINDNGIAKNHPELKDRLNLDVSYDFCENMSDPGHRSEEDHGTKVAGVVAMEINNGFCGVGVAPEVTIGARRVLSDDSSCYYRTGNEFTWKQEKIDITVNSYGSRTIQPIPHDLLRAFKQTVEKGRDGLGIIHVFAGGNDKYEGQSCTYDKYLPNIYTIVVAAITPWGETSPFSSRCANLMVTAPSLYSKANFLITSTIGKQCTGKFGGTSAAAPVVGGVIALTLEANAFLTWRDVHHLVVYTSSDESVLHYSKTFEKNGAGLLVSYDYGFGIINALRMVQSAMFFDPVPALKECEIAIPLNTSKFRPVKQHLFITVESDGCIDSPSQTVMYLEHVQLEVEISYPRWYNLEIDLISPMQTIAKMLEKEEPRNDTWPSPFKWVFDSVATWSESPLGIWSIIINDNHSPNTTTGKVHSLNLILYGTSERPRHVHVNY